ncbi:MAG: hypothetical protein ACT4P7_15860 [Gemmatimonadaceae bacterium]
MSVFALALLAQLGAPLQATPVVLAFPESGLDDTAAYRGYTTRLFRDAAGNTAQIYLDGREGRVVHLLADSENQSIGFSARDGRGAPLQLRWDGHGADVARSGRTRTLQYRLAADVPRLDIGLFLLGSMRVERDFQYARRHRGPLGATPWTLPELDRLLAALARLGPMERTQHLGLLGAPDIPTLRARLQPSISVSRTDSTWHARVTQPTFDGRDTLTLEFQADPRQVVAVRGPRSISLRARQGTRVSFGVSIATSTAPLTPLARAEIFNPQFLEFLAVAQSAAVRGSRADSLRARWLERQVRGVELLSSREKLMAGLPTYATYFGRDMLVTALMMQPIWRGEMSEFVVASVLRKLSPSGQVSHEEALGGQAVREGAAEYAALVGDYVGALAGGQRAVADSLLSRARIVLQDLRRVRENYHMIDDEYQLPVLAARWLADSSVSAERKRAFLLDSSDGGGSRLARLLRELALVTHTTTAYAADPVAGNLVSFPARDSARWAATSWRDSNAGYAGGRFAMDVNAIWVPRALEAVGHMLQAIRALGISVDSLARTEAALFPGTSLARYAREPRILGDAINTWRGASRHFLVRLGPADVRTQVSARLATMPEGERAYWRGVLAATGADRDSLVFLALALDAQGQAVGVANSDVATRLFLGDGWMDGPPDSGTMADALRDVRLFTRAYPGGLLVEGLGPVVANDAFAPPSVWRAFQRDHYHGPRVVWGREVNLFLLGAARQIAATSDSSGAAAPRRADGEKAAYVTELRAALEIVQSAVEASGFRSELWSYEIRGRRLVPIRYGSGSDVQLWSTTDLVVQFALSRLSR